MLADKMLRALLHRRCIEWPVFPTHASAQVGQADRAVKNDVVIVPAGGGEARVKTRVHLARPQQRHVVRQVANRAPRSGQRVPPWYRNESPAPARCTPASVRPATVTFRARWRPWKALPRHTAVPSASLCRCQPEKFEPSYSRMAAMRIVILAS